MGFKEIWIVAHSSRGSFVQNANGLILAYPQSYLMFYLLYDFHISTETILFGKAENIGHFKLVFHFYLDFFYKV